jgi:curli biogenesis system outer membrane secretion channel CsgG
MTTKPFIVLLALGFLAACASPTAAPVAETPAEKIDPDQA